MFYPRLCEGCSKPLVAKEEILCIGCSMELPLTSYHHIADNETALRIAGRVPFIHATSFAYFTNEGLLQHLLHGLKYKGKQETGTYLGRLFAQDLKSTSWISSVAIIIPVPLHPAKEAKRGYNQSMLIAEGMGEALGIPASDEYLVKVKSTESQTNKSRGERAENMTGAFRLHDQHELSGKHVLLCDDVLTSGATTEACVQALVAVEGIKISIATIGIAMS